MKRTAAILIALIVFLGQAAPPARAQACGATYTVRAGESLYSIAERCRISYVVLISINFEINDPSKIYPGQVIRLEAEAPLDAYRKPASGPADTAGYQEGGAYIVRRGDSLARIAYLYGTTVPALVEVNPALRQSAVIVPGQVLLLPPTARHAKGWVGVSTTAADGGDEIEVRVVDFPAYAALEMDLINRDEEGYVFDTIEVKTDARGEARATVTLPWYAWEDEVYQVLVTNLDDGDAAPVKSPGIKIVE